MSCLLLRLAAPLQSYGVGDEFNTRSTTAMPTKSAVVGLVAGALGRPRGEAVDDLVALRFGVRADRPGQIVEDYQTARAPGHDDAEIVHKLYLEDAVFLVVLEGDPALIETVAAALKRPVWSPFLGRKACPPAGPLFWRVDGRGLEDVLAAEPSLDLSARAANRVMWSRDAGPDEVAEVEQDLPIDFAILSRRYGRRRFVVGFTDFEAAAVPHDPFEALEVPA